jgi:hypothetical protein
MTRRVRSRLKSAKRVELLSCESYEEKSRKSGDHVGALPPLLGRAFYRLPQLGGTTDAPDFARSR